MPASSFAFPKPLRLPFRLNHAHPLARGLYRAWIPLDGSLRMYEATGRARSDDYVRPNTAAASGIARAVTPFGIMLDTSAINNWTNGSCSRESGDSLDVLREGTALIAVDIGSGNGTSWNAIWGDHSYREFLVYNGNLDFYISGIGHNGTFSVNGRGLCIVGLSVSQKAERLRLIVDGEIIEEFATGGSSSYYLPQSEGFSHGMYWGNNVDNDKFDGKIGPHLIWDRELSVDELREAGVDLFAPWRPSARVIVPASGGGGGGATIPHLASRIETGHQAHGMHHIEAGTV